VISFFDNVVVADVRIHGNGFLQAELPDGKKMHVWNKDPDFPRQNVSTQVHNHVSPFMSAILYGRLRNIEYQMKPVDNMSKISGKVYAEHEAVVRNGKDTELAPTGNDFYIGGRRTFDFAAGSVYDFPGADWMFHETIPQTKLVIAVVERRGEKDASRKPIIMVPLGSEPDNEFDRYGHQEYALDLYHQVVEFLST